MAYFKHKIDKVKINVVGDNFWYQPSILTLSRRKYAARPYKSLQKLLKNENLLSQNFLFTFNGDEDFELFRMAQKLNEIDFYLNQEQREEIEEKGFFDHRLKQSKITIRYDKKSLIALKRGYIPYFDKKWILETFRTSKSLTLKLTQKGYVEVLD